MLGVEIATEIVEKTGAKIRTPRVIMHQNLQKRKMIKNISRRRKYFLGEETHGYLCSTHGPGPDAHVVYVDGTFDVFHAGHVEILRLARGLGDFLLVGIHTDETVSANKGAHRPFMNLHKRS